MIGIYNYTVWLTYLSLISACSGIYITLAYDRPLLGIICLLFSGLCDAFDGKVASTKQDRTQFEKRYGIQIDSLSDIVAFGVLPGAIGIEILKKSDFLYMDDGSNDIKLKIASALIFIVAVFYVLAALIRLAFFNVSEENRQDSGSAQRENYTGLPVTTAALVFPLVFFLQKISESVFVIGYFIVMLLMGFAFLMNVKIKKLSLKGVILTVIAGFFEFGLIAVFIICLK